MLNYHHLSDLVETSSRQLIALDAISRTFQTARPLRLICMFPVSEAAIRRVWKRGSNSIVRHASWPCKLIADFLRVKDIFIIHSPPRLTRIVRHSIFLGRKNFLLTDPKLSLRVITVAMALKRLLVNEHSASLFRRNNRILKRLRCKKLKLTLSWPKKMKRIRTRTVFLQSQHNQRIKCHRRYLLPHNWFSKMTPSLP